MTDETERLETMSKAETARVNTALEELEADRARARRFFWTWLVLATVLTLAGNAGHALLPAKAPTWVALTVALVPPVIALIAIHAVTVLARVGEGHRAKGSARLTFAAAVGVTVLLAAEAAALSYVGLRDVALRAGWAGWAAMLFPIGIDAGIALATLALYHLRPASEADLRAARDAARAERAKMTGVGPSTKQASQPPATRGNSARPATTAAESTRRPTSQSASQSSTVVAEPPSRPVGQPSGRPATTPETDHLADRVISHLGLTTSREDVARILSLSTAGASARKVAEATGRDRGTVGKVVKAARELADTDAPTLTAVG